MVAYCGAKALRFQPRLSKPVFAILVPQEDKALGKGTIGIEMADILLPTCAEV